MEPNFTPSDREVVKKRIQKLPAYVNHGKTGTGLLVELKTTRDNHGWQGLVRDNGWYIDRIQFPNMGKVYVSIFPITEVPDSDGK